MSIDTIIYLIAGPLFIISFCAYFYVKIRLKPKDPDLDDYYHEFEHLHPAYARYLKWSKITFAAASVAVLLCLLAWLL